ncbi:hypothetical protein ACFQX6_64420 [Streptosporangium lutulentum]
MLSADAPLGTVTTATPGTCWEMCSASAPPMRRYTAPPPGGQSQADLVDLGRPGAPDEQPSGGQEHRPPVEPWLRVQHHAEMIRTAAADDIGVGAPAVDGRRRRGGGR